MSDMHVEMRLLFRTSERKARTVVDKIARAADAGLDVVSCEAYPKDHRLVTCIVRCTLDESSVGDAMAETIRINGFVAQRWTVEVPHYSDNGQFEFRGAAPVAQLRVPGLAYADFRLSNF
jgi:hypothetical protein